MIKTSYQTPELRDSNDEIIQQGAFGKQTALSNATNDGWIDYVMNNLEAIHDSIGDSAATLDGNGHVVEPANLAIGDEDGVRLKTGYLKLSGGTVAGTLNVQQNLKFQDNQENVYGGVYIPASSATEQYAQFYGGESTGVAGAKLTLYPAGDGRFSLTGYSNDGGNSYTLTNDNSGNLNWRGYALGWAKDYVMLNGSKKMTGALVRIASNLDPSNESRTESTSVNMQDKNGSVIGTFYSSLGSAISLNAMRAVNPSIGVNNWADLRINVNTNGTYNLSLENHQNLTLSITSNSRHIPTTAWTDAKYFPLAGGTLSSNSAKITMGNGASFISSYSTGMVLCGDSDTSNASQFVLYTKANGEGFVIDAGDGTTRKRLQGRPNGDLTWNGTKLAYETSAVRNVTSLSSQSGSNTATFTMRGNSALIAVKRGSNAQLFMCDYWTANSVTLSTVGTAIATVTKSANSNEVTITNTSSSGISAQIVSGAALL